MSLATTKQQPKRIVSELSELGATENERRSAERRRWFREGRCPACGELGVFVRGAPVCSVHGPYPFVPEPDADAGLDEREMLPED